jgi:Na+-driven multidrug efflux pump
MLKRNEKLVRTKLLQYLAPAIMTNLALQVGNIVDTILVGNILGTNAMSAVQISGTILLAIQIPGWMLAVGGSIVVEIAWGREIWKVLQRSSPPACLPCLSAARR